MILSFISRTIFIRLLGTDYLGVNGLFSNILTILSFAELGLGNALTYRMYKPIAENDVEKLKTLVGFYKNVYRIVYLIITISGLMVIPFLKYLVKAPGIKENIVLLYILFLANTVSSYFYVYKKSVLIADQRNYIVLIYQQAFNLILNIAQIIMLIITHNYIFYLILMIIFNILNNYFCSKKAEANYPFVKEKVSKPLTYEERKSFFRDVKGLFFQKLGSVILDGTDNIVISAMLNVIYVGFVSNYILLLSAVNSLLNQLVGSLAASIGNVNVSRDINKEQELFKKIYFLNAWIYGFITIGFMLLLNEFMGSIWLGNDYVLPFSIVSVIVLHFYINGIHYPMYVFRISMGYFFQYRIASLIAAALNIVLDIILFYKIGLQGIYLATIISRFFITELADIIVVYKHEFRKNPMHYYFMHFLYDILFVFIALIIKLFISFITSAGIIGFILKICVITIIYNGIMLLIFCRTAMFQDLLKIMGGHLNIKLSGRKVNCEDN